VAIVIGGAITANMFVLELSISEQEVGSLKKLSALFVCIVEIEKEALDIAIIGFYGCRMLCSLGCCAGLWWAWVSFLAGCILVVGQAFMG
jgi:hypothetical protein